MIEFCNRRRMVAAIAIMIGASILVLLFEDHLPFSHENKSVASAIQEEGTNISGLCPDGSELKVSKSCQPCSDQDLKMYNSCKATGYKEVVSCNKPSGQPVREFSRSCPVSSSIKERKFWLFECSTTLVGIFSYSVVYLRQRRLDRLLQEKVNRQIAAGI